MLVTFISECEKNSLKKTRRVLDAFANRIGNNTWQTPITQEGLEAVKKLLKQTASKNTAVSCHQLKSRVRTELLWVVGKRNKFNNEGVVAVNYTEQDKFIGEDSNMLTAEIIASSSTIAGLFHDFGKANILFQNKLNPKKKKDQKNYEPYRHEWVSLRLFQAFAGECKTDSEWLNKLSQIKSNTFSRCFKDGVDGGISDNHPINNLPPFAQLVAWLVVTHHRLPLYPKWKENLPPNLKNADDWFGSNFEPIWNSYNCKNADLKELVENNWLFHKLPYQSAIWRANAREIAKNIQTPKIVDYLNEQLFTIHFARLCLILADHYSSSLSLEKIEEKWRDDSYKVWANTDRETKQYKQKLDEHLIGVAYNTRKIALALPKLNPSLNSLKTNSKLTDDVVKKHKDKFGWQDKAKKLAKKIGKQTVESGFFGINMASTGTGKTLANAKIMATIGNEVGRLRFSVALGLRTLTLQTGKAYRAELDLQDDLAIMVGGIAVKQLFVNEQKQQTKQDELEGTGSESENNSFNDFEMDYQGVLSEHSLSHWTKNKDNLNKLIQAPVLVSTIDHLIPATEGARGDKHIAATLRLFTSDLVIDEPDDFGLNDLPALCRLVNWAGMLGSRVLLSTATMPPALSNALFRAYKAGWGEYAKANIEKYSGEITCAWFDEFNVKSVKIQEDEDYKKEHHKFVEERIEKIRNNNNPKHLGEILNIVESDKSPVARMAKTIFNGIDTLHKQHKIKSTDKNISIGLVRMANINPLVAVAKTLLEMDSPKNTCIHYCVYHSRFPLALRSYIENKLDRILNRKDENSIWQQAEIKEKIENSTIKNHIFVVLASPVAEVGRDHDYDWTIIEPSSMRSIIQIAGRVLRHRDIVPNKPSKPNILLLNKNRKALKGENPCFVHPGFETKTITMNDDDLNNVLEESQYKNITAIQRIALPDDFNGKIEVHKNLVNLEHKSLQNKLLSPEYGAKLWWDKNPTWCGEMQRQQPFRQSKKDNAYYLWIDGEYCNISWRYKNEDVYPAKFSDDSSIVPISNDELDDFGKNCGFWFDIEIENIYQKLAKDFNIELKEVSKKFGELRLVEYKKTTADYKFHSNLGVYKIIDGENDE